MAGNLLSELKEAVLTFIEVTEKLEMGMRIGLVYFDKTATMLVPVSNDYNQLRHAVNSLEAGSGTSLVEGLSLGLVEIVKNGRVLTIEGITLLPRLIMVTDGEPPRKEDIIAVSYQLGKADIPVSAAGLPGCDVNLMLGIANTSGGMFLLAQGAEFLHLFFLRQLLVVLYVVQMAKSPQALKNKAVLRAFLQEKTNHPVHDAELDAYLVLIAHLAKKGGKPPIDQVKIAPSSASSQQPAGDIEDGATRYLVELHGTTVSKRYSEFHKFNDSLPKDIKKEVSKNFPKKDWIGRNDNKVVKNRALYFEGYLNRLFALGGRAIQLVVEFLSA